MGSIGVLLPDGYDYSASVGSQERQMRRGFAWAVLFLLVTAYPGPGAQAQTGVVLVHGKQGLPEGMQRLATQLVDAGYLVERPEMCWSRGRIYDKAYLDCLADIDLAVERLQERSAKHIVIAGMSLGGNAVLAYGARHGNLTGIVAFAPAHAPEFISRRPDVADSLTR